MKKSSYLFIFGRTPQLSTVELLQFFPAATPVCDRVALVSETDTAPERLMEVLGGTVKIARVRGSIPVLEASEFLQFFPATKSLTFGISTYDLVNPSIQLLSPLKKLLERVGVRARYVVPHDTEQDLSSVVVSKNKLFELVVVPQKSGFLVGETVAVQPFEAWSRRDYGRPFADSGMGMLPPKVARMAVNTATGKGERMLLDPFCGMGTILGEAILTGWHALGSDASADVIEKTRANLEWLITHDPLVPHGVATKSIMPYRLFSSDATHVSGQVAAGSLDAIVTEPYMGTTRWGGRDRGPFPERKKIRNVLRGLEKLYIGCLRDWYRILKVGGKIVIALPKYTIDRQEFFVKKVIDSCENLGYTVLAGPIEYSREQAVVRREFFVLQKN